MEYFSIRMDVIMIDWTNRKIEDEAMFAIEHGRKWAIQKAEKDIEDGILTFKNTKSWMHFTMEYFLTWYSLEDLHDCSSGKDIFQIVHQRFSFDILFGPIDIFRNWPEIYRFDAIKFYDLWYLCKVISKISVIYLTSVQVSKKEKKEENAKMLEKDLDMIIKNYPIDNRGWVNLMLENARVLIEKNEPNALEAFNSLVNGRLNHEDDIVSKLIMSRLKAVGHAIMND